MAYLRITRPGRPGRPDYVRQTRGGQQIYDYIEEHWGTDLLCPANDIPEAFEADGWADDLAYEGATYESLTGEFSIESISEEEYRQETGQEDTPTHQMI